VDVAVFSELIHSDRVFASIQLVDYFSRQGLDAKLVTRRHKDESRIRVGYGPMMTDTGLSNSRAIISANLMSTAVIKRWQNASTRVIHLATLQMQLDAEAIDSISACDMVIAPSRSVACYFQREFPSIKVVTCPWYVPPLRLPIRNDTGAFVPAYTHVPPMSQLVAFLSAALSSGSRIKLELGSGSKARILVRNHFKHEVASGRLSVFAPLSYTARLIMMANAQVIAAIAPGSPFAMPALFAAAVARPLIGFNVPPYDEIVIPGSTGILLPGWSKTATACMTAAGRALGAMLTDSKSLEPLLAGVAGQADRRIAFGMTWFTALGENFSPGLA